VTDFATAKIGDHAYVYKRVDGNLIDDHEWVAHLDYFDDRDGEIHLIRQRWQLIAQDDLVLLDPWADDEETSASRPRDVTP
jgi:hypothetical protein